MKVAGATPSVLRVAAPATTLFEGSRGVANPRGSIRANRGRAGACPRRYADPRLVPPRASAPFVQADRHLLSPPLGLWSFLEGRSCHVRVIERLAFEEFTNSDEL